MTSPRGGGQRVNLMPDKLPTSVRGAHLILIDGRVLLYERAQHDLLDAGVLPSMPSARMCAVAVVPSVQRRGCPLRVGRVSSAQ